MFQQDLRHVLITISQYEHKLEAYRQLLNQEIQFNIKDLYVIISDQSTQVTAYHLHIFLNEPNSQDHLVADIDLLQSIIKSYNNCTSLNLSFTEFAILFLSKENRLLAKLTIQRNSLGQIPPYLLNYARKILFLQIQLHKRLSQFRKIHSVSAEQWIRSHTFIDDQTGYQLFDQTIIQSICPELSISAQIVLRYFAQNSGRRLSSIKMLALLTQKNAKKIEDLLKKKAPKAVQNAKTIDPFIRPQFHDCLERPKTIQNLSHREILSIQKHLMRINSKSKIQISYKIQNYRNQIEKQLVLVCQAIYEIIQLENEIQSQRVQLCLCPDFYPILFYESFNKDRQTYLIPSAFQLYLEGLGVKFELPQLYLVFKRYSTRSDGKLNFNEFCSIFDVCNSQYCQIQKNRLVKSLQDISLQTIKTFLRLVKVLVKNQIKIEKIKSNLVTKVNLRDIFSVFDQDEDSHISMLDFKIVWKKHLLLDLKDDDLALLWHRMQLCKDGPSLIKYEKFICELLPKTKKIENIKKQKTRKQKQGKLFI